MIDLAARQVIFNVITYVENLFRKGYTCEIAMQIVNNPKMYDAPHKVLVPSWDQILAGAHVLCNELSARHIKFDNILVVVRGGMPLSIIISHQLGIKKMSFIRVSRHSSNSPHSNAELTIDELPRLMPQENVLIVEDIVFEGKSIFAAIDHVISSGANVAAVCSLFVDENFETKFMHQMSHNNIPFLPAYRRKNLKWTRFPWECELKEEQKGHIIG